MQRRAEIGYSLLAGFIAAGVVLFGFLIGLIYIWPAFARLWGPFLIAFSVGLFLVGSYWVSKYWGFAATNPPQGLSAAYEIFARYTATTYLVLAVALQGLRHWTAKSGRPGYKHWLAVLLLAPAPPLVIWLMVRGLEL